MKTIGLNPTNEYHLLRHFARVPKNYAQSLLGMQYLYFSYQAGKEQSGVIDPDAIKAALETKGSKFITGIKDLDTPLKVLKLVKQRFEAFPESQLVWELTGGKKIWSFLINYPEQVGFKDLLPIADLTAEQKQRIQLVPRSDHPGENTVMIKTVSGVKLSPLNTIAVGIFDMDEVPFYLVTAYPGDLSQSPEFPSKNQSQEDYTASKKYWDNHVFVS